MTTIVLVRKNKEVVVAGDGQVSMGNTVVKSTASKVRKIDKRGVVAGFAGSTADALTLFERLEAKLEKHAGNLSRAAVELAKDWRTDKYLRRLEALMAIGDKENSYIISGTGDVLEPEGDVIGIGSGGNYALAAGKVLIETEMNEFISDKTFPLDTTQYRLTIKIDSEGNFILDKLSPDNKLDSESLTMLKDAVSGIKKALPAVKTNVGEYVEVKFNLPFRFNYE